MNEKEKPILDQILGADELTRSFRPLNSTVIYIGSSADIYLSLGYLNEVQRRRIHNLKGRLPDKTLLLKVAQPGSGFEQNRQELIRDSIMLADPIVQYFAIASSSVRQTSLGPTMLVEKANGYDVTDPQDSRLLMPEDFARITYQLALINQRFHSRNVSPIHAGKGAFYRKEFDPRNPRPYANPPRVVLFDLVFKGVIPTSGRDRAEVVLQDQFHFVTDLQNLFEMVSQSKLPPVQKIVENISMCGFNSFAQIAQLLDDQYGGKFSAEWRQITGRVPTKPEDAVRFTNTDFSTMAKHYISSSSDFTLGRRGYLVEGLIPDDNIIGGNPQNLFRLTEYEMEIILNSGCRNPRQIRDYVMSPGYSVYERRQFLQKLRDGRTVLDGLLEEMVNRGIITGLADRRQRNLIIGEQILRLILDSTGADPVTRMGCDQILLEDDIRHNRPEEEGYFTYANNGGEVKEVVYDYLSEQGKVID